MLESFIKAMPRLCSECESSFRHGVMVYSVLFFSSPIQPLGLGLNVLLSI